MDKLGGLAAHLYRWLVARDMRLSDEPDDTVNGGGEDGDEIKDGVAGLPPRHARMVAFAAHLLLILEGLGAAHTASDVTERGASEHARQVILYALISCQA